jgi:hypothetical protein
MILDTNLYTTVTIVSYLICSIIVVSMVINHYCNDCCAGDSNDLIEI